MSPRLERWLRAILDLALVGSALVFTASFFPAEVMLTDTIASGGDMGSHYYPGLYMRDVLLAKGQVSGWCPGNYAGYPVFQFYFPLPFLAMAALSSVMPYTVAFKLGTVLGPMLMPLCTYFGLRLMRVPFPGPGIAALATLCFTFMEANSMWGGNIPSTLAGEFSLSLGLSLTVLFFGAVYRATESGRGVAVALTGLLEALVGLSHGYTLLWAGFGSLVQLVATRGWWRRVAALAGIHLLAIGLLAFWLFPLGGYSAWTTAYNHAWPLEWEAWKEVFPPILWPAGGIAVATALFEAIRCVRARTAFPRGLGVLWGTMGVAVLFYFTGHSFHVVDIRFVPFAQLGLCLAAGAGLGYALGRLPRVELLAVAAPLAILPFVQGHVSFIPSWITWNFSGFEAKATWPVLKGIADALRGDFRDPRVVYEHAPDTEALGTVRTFESLPLFAGRSTLEGLYMQSSPTAPAVFYIQSEVSPLPSCPFPDWGCARFKLDRGVEHMQMMNVSDFIARTDKVKAAAAQHPGLEKTSSHGAYELYRLRDNDPRYVVPLRLAPQLVRTGDWKVDAYRWFRRARPGDVVPVFAASATPEEERLFAAVSNGLPERFDEKPLPDSPALREEMPSEDRIVITGAVPGQPLWIRVSYHPRWQALTGEKIWLAGPSFMLVFPKGERVELVFGEGPPVVVGRYATLFGLAIFLATVLPGVGPRFRGSCVRLAGALAAAPPASWVVAPFARTAGWSPQQRRALAAAAVAATLFAVIALAAAIRTVPPEIVYRDALEHFNAERHEEARRLFEDVERAAPNSTHAIHSRYFQGICLLREERWKDAEDTFRRLVRDFPDGLNAAEAQYHVGIALLRADDRAAAAREFEAVREHFPESPWAGHAAERLAELAP